MRYLLNVIYGLLILLGLPWLVWAAVRKGKYRHGFAAKFLGRYPNVPPKTGRRIWIHAVSVGEVNLAAVLLKELNRRWKGYDYVITSTSRTGYELARKKFAEHAVFYAPLDFSWSVARAFRAFQPDLLVLMELEIWPNLLAEAGRRGVPSVIVNGRLGEKSFRNYRRVLPLISRVMKNLSLVLVQDTTCGERFAALGVPPEKIVPTGSLKYDGARLDRNNEKTLLLKKLWGIADSDWVFLAGSTQEPEESLAVETFRTLAEEFPSLRLILVPRHPERFAEVAEMLDRQGLAWTRRTQLAENRETPERILLVDTVGELGAWWGTARIGFVGGSMGNRGGQNMIEPAGYGVAVCFGPNTWNFRDIVRTLLDADAARVVQNGSEMTAFVRHCLENPAFADQLGKKAQNLVVSQQGATAKTVDGMERLW
ncbi:MAG: 3-deoxy-D-manno-octulosonic acid transferase [Planctomycetia bacterium]|nr:3-deoxy-D-manno-octulosonic acid transferase [Planctomycetia bacterium]